LPSSVALTGGQGFAVGYCDLWQIIMMYPGASFILLDKAGHNLQIEQDILFGEAVKGWLNRVAAEMDRGNHV
jgi:pimeloyl-ACP methyl ester carboxylesterase